MVLILSGCLDGQCASTESLAQIPVNICLLSESIDSSNQKAEPNSLVTSAGRRTAPGSKHGHFLPNLRQFLTNASACRYSTREQMGEFLPPWSPLHPLPHLPAIRSTALSAGSSTEPPWIFLLERSCLGRFQGKVSPGAGDAEPDFWLKSSSSEKSAEEDIEQR